ATRGGYVAHRASSAREIGRRLEGNPAPMSLHEYDSIRWKDPYDLGRKRAASGIAILDPMTFAPGRRLGPYELEFCVGAGGLGDVYRARATRLDRRVAIKVLREQIGADEESRIRFHREARAVAALQHRHICTLHDVGHEAGIDFLVMEYLEGRTLSDHLAA